MRRLGWVLCLLVGANCAGPEMGEDGGTACVPSCSPGFGCYDGACLSCCNPTCREPQVCVCSGVGCGEGCGGAWACVDDADAGGPAIDAAIDAGTAIVDENTPGIFDCAECGAGAGWGTPRYAYRGVCSYGNGTVDLQDCDPGLAESSDRRTPLSCSDGSQTTPLRSARGYAFQCVEYARRVTLARRPTWSSITGHAVTWLPSADASRDPIVSAFDNGGGSPPRADDLIVFDNGGPYGHIAVVMRVDADRGELWIAEQNVSSPPRRLAYDAAENTVAPAGAYEVIGWVRVGELDLTCGVRDPFTTSGYTQLVTCPPGYFCDEDDGRCVANGDCGSCPAGTSCRGGLCVCDWDQPVTATTLTLESSTHCFQAAYGERWAEGCSLTSALSSRGGRGVLHLRDLHFEDPMLQSPRLAWTVEPTDVVEVELACSGLDGSVDARARLFLSPDATRPQFVEGTLALAPAAIRCDGAMQTVRFPLSTVPTGTRVGWLRLDPLDGERRYEDAEVWVREIRLRRDAGSCGAPGEPCCATPPACNVGLTCSAGVCVSVGCTDDCAVGQTRCSGALVQTCGSYDADPCRDWSPSSACAMGSCSGDACPTCTDDCAIGQTRCSGALVQTCGSYDADPCRDWSPSSACPMGSCSGDACPTCIDECAVGQTRCSGSSIQTCGNHDGDPCREWSLASACAGGGSCSGDMCRPPETCNGIDDDGNGIVDDPLGCWRTIYRFQNAAGARCLGTSTSPPAACSGYVYEREAFVLAVSSSASAFEARQCSRMTDHIVVSSRTGDRTALEAAGYDCSLVLGYAFDVGSGPARTPFPNLCRLWRFSYSAGGAGAHLFTVGADSTAGLTCEPPARADVPSNVACFSGVPSGC